MALFQTGNKVEAQPITYNNEIAAKIQQRRYQILVHSLIYYELDTSIVSDHKWSEWAAELVQLQKQNPEIADKVIFAEAFKDFDGSTGFDLPFRDEQIVNIAYRLLSSSSIREHTEAAMSLIRVATTKAQYAGFYDKHPDKGSKRPIQTSRKAVNKVEPTKRKKLF